MNYHPRLVLAAWQQAGLPVATPEYRFHAARKWRFDFAFVEQRCAVECQGGIWIQGRHTRGAALKKEWEKLNTAASLGWLIFYCEPSEICSLKLIAQLRPVLQ